MTTAEPRAWRSRLGTELRRLRLLAGVSGREVSRRIGVSQAHVSRIERGKTVPSLPEVQAWAEAVAAPEQARVTLASLTEAALNEVETWRGRMSGGLAAMQADIETLEAAARTMRSFQPTLVPGLLQTAEYARRIFALSDVIGDPDYAAAVAARIQRQQVLYDETKTFEFILTETALRWRPGPPDMLAAQLDRVSTVATLRNVTVGVIPLAAEAQAIPWCGFELHEDNAGGEPPFVLIELPHAGLTISDAADVKLYQEQFTRLGQSAVYGQAADTLLARVATETRAG